MSQYDYDLFTIGGGSGGVRAARFAGQTGARVGLAEKGALTLLKSQFTGTPDLEEK